MNTTKQLKDEYEDRVCMIKDCVSELPDNLDGDENLIDIESTLEEINAYSYDGKDTVKCINDEMCHPVIKDLDDFKEELSEKITDELLIICTLFDGIAKEATDEKQYLIADLASACSRKINMQELHDCIYNNMNQIVEHILHTTPIEAFKNQAHLRERHGYSSEANDEA